MENRFILNVIHRPEMVPEYAEKVTGHGKEEDIGRKALLTESLDIFKTQQAIAHKYKIKTTIQMTYASLLTARQWHWPRNTMKSMATKLPCLFSGFPAKSFVKNIRQKIFVSGCFPWTIKKRL